MIGAAPRSRSPTSKAGGAKAPAKATSSPGAGSTAEPGAVCGRGIDRYITLWLTGSWDWISPPAWPRQPSLDRLRAVGGLLGCWGGLRPTPTDHSLFLLLDLPYRSPPSPWLPAYPTSPTGRRGQACSTRLVHPRGRPLHGEGFDGALDLDSAASLMPVLVHSAGQRAFSHVPADAY